MSANTSRPHVYVLPEDDANRELANGFHQEVALTRQRQMQVLPPAGGWTKVLKDFESEHVKEMDRCRYRFMVLLIDFDEDPNRLTQAKAAIPERLANRVLILGVWSEPEKLKPHLGACETIGVGIAKDCRDGTNTTWGHPLLQHNATEVERFREQIRTILF